MEARKEAEVQSATNADFHSEGVGNEGLHLALGIHSKNQKYYHPDEHKNAEHSADSEEDVLARVRHSAPFFEPGESGSSPILAQKRRYGNCAGARIRGSTRPSQLPTGGVVEFPIKLCAISNRRTLSVAAHMSYVESVALRRIFLATVSLALID